METLPSVLPGPGFSTTWPLLTVWVLATETLASVLPGPGRAPASDVPCSLRQWNPAFIKPGNAPDAVHTGCVRAELNSKRVQPRSQ